MTGPAVLITGVSGAIGSALRVGLAERGYSVHGVDLVAPPDLAGLAGFAAGDCSDPAIIDPAVAAVDAVVHLAGIPTEADLPTILQSHVRTTAAVLTAMRRAGIRRLVYASSNHAVGWTERGPRLSTEVRPRPDTYYGVGKVAAEALVSLSADRYGIEGVCLRIGSFLPRPTTRRHLASWLSPADAVRLVDAALTAPDVTFTVGYGISANTRGWWDLTSVRALGYLPLDDAESYAAGILATPETAADQLEGERVGGDFAGPDYAEPLS